MLITPTPSHHVSTHTERSVTEVPLGDRARRCLTEHEVAPVRSRTVTGSPTWGRLEPGTAAPEEGERFELLAEVAGVTIEQILSGALPAAGDYDQDHHEWVVVLEGAAELEVDGQHRTMQAGDWLLLPAGTPHRVTHTEQGTSWLAVRVPAPNSPDDRRSGGEVGT